MLIIVDHTLETPHPDDTGVPNQVASWEKAVRNAGWSICWESRGEEAIDSRVRFYEHKEKGFMVELSNTYGTVCLVRCQTFLQVVTVIDRLRVLVELDYVPPPPFRGLTESISPTKEAIRVQAWP